MPGCVCAGLSASMCRGTAGRRHRQPRGASRSPDLRLDFCSRPTAGETDTLGSCLRVGRSLVLRGGAGRLSAVVEGLPRELVRLALEAALPGSCVLGTRGAGRRCATPAPTTSQGAPTPRPHDEQGRSSKARRLGPGCQGGGDSHRRQAHSCAGCPWGWAWSPQRAAVCPLPVSCRPRPVVPPAVLQRL